MGGHRAEMLVKTLLRGLVVVGSHAEDGIGAAQVEFAQLIEHLRRRIAAAADDQGHAPGDVVGDEHGYHGPLGVVERRGLGRRTQGHDIVHAAVDHVVDHPRQRLVVHAALRRERSDQGDSHARKFVL